MSFTKDSAELATHAPCVRCNACEPACQEKLNPELMHYLLNLQEVEQTTLQGLMHCTECQACNKVCPSHIPLAQQFGFAKQHLVLEAEHLQQTAQAKARYEARNQRLTRIKIERAEQHSQRAKQSTSADAIAAALARAKARKENKSDNV